MKAHPLILLFLLIASAARAAVAISGTGNYTQNFNSLGTSSVSWTQGITVNSWYIQRTATTPPSTLTASDGSGSFSGNAYNLGVAAGADRALGSAPTTAHGNYNRVLILRNSGTAALQITNVAYAIKVFKTNQFLTTQEPVNFSYQLASAESTLSSALNTSGTPGGYTADAGLSMNVNFTGAGMPAAPGQVTPPVSITRSAAPATALIVNPGQYLALRWEDINENNSTDAYLGLDDVNISYQPVTCVITPEILNLQRLDNGTPSLLSDDSWSFNLRVTGVGTGTQGWNAAAIGAGGSYGSTVPVILPVSILSRTIVVNDVQFPACTASVTVTQPPPVISYVLPDRPQSISFSPADTGAHTYTRTLQHSDLSWTWYGTSTAAGVRDQPGVPSPAPRYFDFNASNSTQSLVSETVNITEAGPGVKVRIRLAAFTTSDTGMETDDQIIVRVLVGNQPGFSTGVQSFDVYSGINGIAAFSDLRVADPGINYGSSPGQTPFPGTPFQFREYSINIPTAIAPYALVAVTGLNNSNNEHWLVDSISFESSVCEVSAEVLSLSRSNPANDLYDPAGDEFSAIVTVSNPVPGPSDMWISGTASGSYNGPQYSLGPWPVSGGPVSVVIADADDPACQTTITVTPPPRLVFGTVTVRGLTGALATGISPTPTLPGRWTSNEVQRTLSMDASSILADDNAGNLVTANWVYFPSGTSPLYVSGILEAVDSSNGSNFETTDFAGLTAVCDTPGGIVRVPLLVRYDKNGNGVVNGYGLGGSASDVIDYMANIHLDELNRSQRHYSATFTERLLVYGQLPAETQGVTVEVSGRVGGNNSLINSEMISLRELLVSDSPPRAGLDWDSDGQFDVDELLTGTDPFDHTSLTRFQTASATSTGGDFTFNGTVLTAPGVYYGVYASASLNGWGLLGTPVAGDGSVKSFSISDEESAARTFFKIVARPDAAFPATLP